MNAEERDAFYDELVRAVGAGEWSWGEAVRRLRVDVAGANQATFARMTGISVRTLQKLEYDEGNPTVETLRAVLEPFGLTLGIQRKERG